MINPHLILVHVNGLDFEVDPDGGGLLWVEGVVGESEEERGLADAALADDQQLQGCEEGVAVHGHGALVHFLKLTVFGMRCRWNSLNLGRSDGVGEYYAKRY